MILTTSQDVLATWLCSRIGLAPTSHLRCIGQIRNGQIIAVVGYDNFNGASIQMHSAGEGNWITKDLLWACFDYPFNVCKANVVLGLIPSGNEKALKFNKHLGFETEYVLEGGHPDGALVMMVMKRANCRFLNMTRRNHGQEVRTPAST